MEELIKQLQIWNVEEEYLKMIDTIEALPDQDLTPWLISELAKAYNNLAQPQDRHLFRKAVKLLLSVEEECCGEHNWNFRLAYAYLYLDQERKALQHFQKALEYLPGDEDTQNFIDLCYRGLALPLGLVPFRERTVKGWEAFLSGEEELRRMMDEKADGDSLLGVCSSLLQDAFANAQFELGRNGEKYDLILTPQGDQAELFKLLYFRNHVPEEILEHWNVFVGRQPGKRFLLRMNDREISAGDVLVWPEVMKEQGSIGLTLYCEKLLPLLGENENMVYSMMTILLDQVIGEVAAIRYIDYMELTDKKLEGEPMVMESLPEFISEQTRLMDWESCSSPDQLTERYTAYQHEPNQEENWYLREDIIAGMTCCPRLIHEYYRGEEFTSDRYHEDGVTAGFFYYLLEGVENGRILDVRELLEQQILEKAGKDAITFIGGATGTVYGYLDFIAWDFKTVLESAAEVFGESDLEAAYFHSFRRDVNGIIL